MPRAESRRRKAQQLAKQLEVDLDLAYQVLDSRLSKKRAQEIQGQRINYEPFVVLAHIMLDAPTTNPLITFDRQSTNTLTTLVSGLFGNECQKRHIAVAALGQAYPVDQLVNEEIANIFGAQVTTLAEKHFRYFPITTIPVYYNQQSSHLPKPILPPIPDTRTEEKSLTLRTICFPCTLIGRFRDLEPFLSQEEEMDPLIPRSEKDPALQKLKQFLAAKLSLAETSFFFTVAPLPEEAVMEQVTTFYASLHRQQDLENAKNLALSFSTTSVIAASAYYGKKDNVEHISLVIQRADTLEVLETYIYETTDFPEGPEEAERFFNDLTFTWGATQHYVIEGILPVKHCEHCGKTMVRYYNPENYMPSPHVHLPEKGH